jgi:hypothetical protein
MKKLTIILSLFLLFLVIDQTYAQLFARADTKKEPRSEKRRHEKVAESKVNVASVKSFMKEFGNLSKVTWIKTDDYDKAVFTREAHTLNAYYDGEGQLVGTTTLKSFSDLPKKGQENLKILFWNYTVQQVIWFQNNPGNKTPLKLWNTEITESNNYLVEMLYGFRRIVLYVDPDGKISLFKKL